MAKSPTKSTKATPKAAGKSATTTKRAAAKPAKDAAVKKVVKTIAEPAVAALKTRATKPKATKNKTASKERSLTIVQLAADIIADRIVPTIEQIKAIAVSAITHEGGKGEGSKAKKKKK